MTTTITPTEDRSVADAIDAAHMLIALVDEAIHGNDQPITASNYRAAALLVDWGWAVQIAVPTEATPATYRATRAGLIAAQTTAAA